MKSLDVCQKGNMGTKITRNNSNLFADYFLNFSTIELHLQYFHQIFKNTDITLV